MIFAERVVELPLERSGYVPAIAFAEVGVAIKTCLYFATVTTAISVLTIAIIADRIHYYPISTYLNTLALSIYLKSWVA